MNYNISLIKNLANFIKKKFLLEDTTYNCNGFIFQFMKIF